jgi:uncharacterized membrane protein
MSKDNKTAVSKESKHSNTPREFVFGKENYMLMIVGMVVLAIGFALMAGSADGDIFEFRRVTLAPIVVIAGFVIEVFAIFKKPKDNN